jgi:protein-arginine kinase activator protein McsA
MTSAIHVLEQINEQLVCPICLERLCVPRVLDCMHTFCTGCLQRIANNDASKAITCPTCRGTTPIPESGVEEMKANFFINQMLELVKNKADELKREIREARRCEACDMNESADSFATSR